MNKMMFAIAVVLACGVSLAAMTEEEKAAKKAAAQEKIMKLVGGIVEKPSQGRVAVVNCQSKIAADDIRGMIAKMTKAVRVNVDYSESKGEAFDIAGAKLPGDAKAAVFVVDDANLPMSLVAIESGWGVINVATLSPGKRFNTEFNRVVTMTFGGCGVSQFKGSQMQTIRSVEDLDKLIGDGFTFDSIAVMTRNLENLGVTQSQQTTYKRACEEGWAAQPTNEYQSAIWERVKAEQSEKPSNPIRIVPGQKPQGR